MLAPVMSPVPHPTHTLHTVHTLSAAVWVAGKERRRNAELAHRLQQLHAEQVDVLELQKNYKELQEAHLEQVRWPLQT